MKIKFVLAIPISVEAEDDEPREVVLERVHRAIQTATNSRFLPKPWKIGEPKMAGLHIEEDK